MENDSPPEGFQPLSTIAKHGAPESYWTERNALVDAVLSSSTLIDGKNVFMAEGWDLPGSAEIRARYHAAYDALAAFDSAHDGAPLV